MNIFLKANSGIFVSTGDISQITISERIISAICFKISEADNPLSLKNWIDTIGKIPEQITLTEKSGTKDYLNQTDISCECISKDNDKSSKVNLTNGINNLIKKLPTLDSLMCLSIPILKNDNIIISFSYFSIGKKNFSYNLKETLINYSDLKISEKLNQLFHSYNPLKNNDFYVCVK
ncbi:MAG: hypothetical protein ABF289_03965 [Clostridiales bacterium]